MLRLILRRSSSSSIRSRCFNSTTTSWRPTACLCMVHPIHATTCSRNDKWISNRPPQVFSFSHIFSIQRFSTASNNSISSSTQDEDDFILTQSTAARLVWKNTNEKDLNDGEIVLKRALHEYFQVIKDDDQQDEQLKQRKKQALLNISHAYQDLEYWQDALLVEESSPLGLASFYPTSDGVDDDFDVDVDLHDYADWLYRRGKLHMRLDQYVIANRLYQQAEKAYQQALGKYGSDDSVYHADIGHVVISMAGIPYARDQYREALELLRQAEPHFRYSGQTQNSVTTASTLSSSSSSSSQLSSAHPGLVKCLQHQGLVHRSLEDYTSALEVYQQALLALDSTRSNNTNNQQDDDIVFEEQRQGLQMDVADMLAALDKYDDALQVYQTIWDRHEEMMMSTPSSSANNNKTALHGILLHAMGRIHAQQGHYELAQKQLIRALRIKERVLGGNDGSGGKVATDDDDTDADSDSDENPLSSHIVFHPEVGKTLQALGAVYAIQKDADKKHLALQCFQKALQIAVWQAKMETKQHETTSDKTVVQVEQDDNNVSVNQHPEVMLVLRNIAILKGEKVPKWGETV